MPCKHLAATFYLLAEAFDEDPVLILRWRGREREALLGRLRELRSVEGPDDADPRTTTVTAGTSLALADLVEPGDRTDRFWQPAPPLPERPAVLEADSDLILRQLPVPDAGFGGAKLVEVLRTGYQRFAAGD